jgi:hypothetical protein
VVEKMVVDGREFPPIPTAVVVKPLWPPQMREVWVL